MLGSFTHFSKLCYVTSAKSLCHLFVKIVISNTFCSVWTLEALRKENVGKNCHAFSLLKKYLCIHMPCFELLPLFWILTKSSFLKWKNLNYIFIGFVLSPRIFSGWVWEGKLSAAGTVMTIRVHWGARPGNMWAQFDECKPGRIFRSYCFLHGDATAPTWSPCAGWITRY